MVVTWIQALVRPNSSLKVTRQTEKFSRNGSVRSKSEKTPSATQMHIANLKNRWNSLPKTKSNHTILVRIKQNLDTGIEQFGLNSSYPRAARRASLLSLFHPQQWSLPQISDPRGSAILTCATSANCARIFLFSNSCGPGGSVSRPCRYTIVLSASGFPRQSTGDEFSCLTIEPAQLKNIKATQRPHRKPIPYSNRRLKDDQ